MAINIQKIRDRISEEPRKDLGSLLNRIHKDYLEIRELIQALEEAKAMIEKIDTSIPQNQLLIKSVWLHKYFPNEHRLWPQTKNEGKHAN